MLTSLAVALSSLSLAVPYLPQTEALCGGAAAAMVFRYWGDVHADVEPFAPLVEKRPGGVVGIADDVLVGAIEKRGWRTFRFTGSLDSLKDQIQKGRPVIILVADRGIRNHFVVVTGIEPDGVVVHDPTWGPSRRVLSADLMRVWRPTGFWSLVILPPEKPAAINGEIAEHAGQFFSADSASSALTVVNDKCDRLLNKAIADASGRPAAEARDILDRVRLQCPAEAGPLRELAGIRFSERRWRDAADLAEAAVAKNAADQYAWEVLASSRFMLEDIDGSLRAWNQIDKPRVNLVQIDGLTHTRFQTIATVMGLKPNMVLTSNAFRLAERRLQALPDRAAARLTIRPEPDGFVTVKATVVERDGAPRGIAGWAAAALEAGINREVRTTIPGPTGQGELWTATWRWWDGRPRIAVGFAAPHEGSVLSVDASWESQRYGAAVEESRTRGGLSLTNWLAADVRYSVTSGIDSWHGARTGRTIFAGGALERRWRGDRWSLAGSGTAWIPVGSASAFQAGDIRGAFRLSRAAEGWVYLADAGVAGSSRAAPLTVWPRAGEGHAGDVLLRAHPLLDRGAIDSDNRSVFGRTLAYTHAEVQRWIVPATPVRFGVAAFADVARASRRRTPEAGSTTQIDMGGGVRVRIPGSAGALRVDIAHGLRDGADALTVGWQF